MAKIILASNRGFSLRKFDSYLELTGDFCLVFVLTEQPNVCLALSVTLSIQLDPWRNT